MGSNIVFHLGVVSVYCILGSVATPLPGNKAEGINIHGLRFLGSTSTKELYITKGRVRIKKSLIVLQIQFTFLRRK